MQRFASIQVLRAAAALGVVLFHLMPGFVVGAAGVDVFFVISGFIMGTVGVGETPGAFLGKRIVRIMPLYWLVTLLMCAGSRLPGLFQHFGFDTASLVRSLLFIPYADPSGRVWPLVVSGWTLNAEMLFYAIFAAGLAFRRAVPVTTVVLLALVAAGPALDRGQPLVQAWTDPILLEFAAGLWLARAIPVDGRPVLSARPGLGLLVAGVLGFALAAWSGVDSPRLLVWGLPAFAIVAGAVAIERAGAWPRLRLAEAVGDSSYSLYLLHGLVIDAVRKLVHAGPTVQPPLTVLASVVVAYGSYRLIERPAARALGRRRPGSTRAGLVTVPLAG